MLATAVFCHPVAPRSLSMDFYAISTLLSQKRSFCLALYGSFCITILHGSVFFCLKYGLACSHHPFFVHSMCSCLQAQSGMLTPSTFHSYHLCRPFFVTLSGHKVACSPHPLFFPALFACCQPFCVSCISFFHGHFFVTKLQRHFHQPFFVTPFFI